MNLAKNKKNRQYFFVNTQILTASAVANFPRENTRVSRENRKEIRQLGDAQYNAKLLFCIVIYILFGD